MIINCDGGARGNPGPAAIGFVIWDEDRQKLKTHAETIGTTTNNVAEYAALIKALQAAAELKAKQVDVFMDSQLIVRQLAGMYKVHSKNLLPLFRTVKELEKMFSLVQYRHVYRSDRYQKEADTLLNAALDQKI